MENPTAFDLSEAICRWQKDLSDSPAFAAGNLEELESHLRASVVVLKAKGLSEEEAFLIASRRLGDQFALEREFAKVNAGSVWLTRGIWMLAGIVLLHFIVTLSSAISRVVSIPLHNCLPSRIHIYEGTLRDVTALASEAILIAVTLRLLTGKSLKSAEWFYHRLSSPWQGAFGLLLIVVFTEALNLGSEYYFVRFVGISQQSHDTIFWGYARYLTNVILPPIVLGLLAYRRVRESQVALRLR